MDKNSGNKKDNSLRQVASASTLLHEICLTYTQCYLYTYTTILSKLFNNPHLNNYFLHKKIDLGDVFLTNIDLGYRK